MNRLPLIYDNIKLDQPLKPLIKILNKDISIEAIKKAEKENCYVIRLVEQFGKTCETGFELKDNYKLTETNLMEWEEFKTIKRDEKIFFKPFFPPRIFGDLGTKGGGGVSQDLRQLS